MAASRIRARNEGRITEGLTNAHVVEWIRHVHTLLRMRDDLDEAAQRTERRVGRIVPTALSVFGLRTFDRTN
jgi:hypothetical protein